MATADNPAEPARGNLERPLPRRELFRLVARAGVGFAGLALAGCGAPPSPQAPTPSSGGAAVKPAGPAKPTGRLVIGVGSVASAIDPAKGRTSPSTSLYNAIWDPIVRLNTVTGKVEPAIAESWKQLDDKTVEFKIRSGLKFHNGRDLTADDVKISTERMLSPDAAKKGLIVGQLIRDLAGVEVVDRSTFRLVSRAPSPLIPTFATRVLVLAGKELEEQGEEAYFKSACIGTGAFKYKEWVKDSHLELVAADNSWRTPKVAELRFVALAEDSTRLAALQSGQIDIAHNVPPDQIDRLQGAGFKLDWILSAANYTLDLYGPPDSPHAKLEVRQAIAHAIDWAAIVKEIFRGYGKVGNGLHGGHGSAGWIDDPVKYDYSPAKAKDLLTQAGYPNGFKTKFQASRGFILGDAPTAEAVIGFLKAVNVDAEVEITELATFTQRYLSDYAKGRAPLHAHRTSYENVMDMGPRLINFDDKKSVHKYGWNDKTFDDLLAKSETELDPKKREQLLIQANRMVRDQAIAICPFYPPEIIMFGPKVTGAKAQPDAILWVDDVAKS